MPPAAQEPRVAIYEGNFVGLALRA